MKVDFVVSGYSVLDIKGNLDQVVLIVLAKHIRHVFLHNCYFFRDHCEPQSLV